MQIDLSTVANRFSHCRLSEFIQPLHFPLTTHVRFFFRAEHRVYYLQRSKTKQNARTPKEVQGLVRFGNQGKTVRFASL